MDLELEPLVLLYIDGRITAGKMASVIKDVCVLYVAPRENLVTHGDIFCYI